MERSIERSPSALNQHIVKGSIRYLIEFSDPGFRYLRLTRAPSIASGATLITCQLPVHPDRLASTLERVGN